MNIPASDPKPNPSPKTLAPVTLPRDGRVPADFTHIGTGERVTLLAIDVVNADGGGDIMALFMDGRGRLKVKNKSGFTLNFAEVVD